MDLLGRVVVDHARPHDAAPLMQAKPRAESMRVKVAPTNSDLVLIEARRDAVSALLKRYKGDRGRAPLVGDGSTEQTSNSATQRPDKQAVATPSDRKIERTREGDKAVKLIGNFILPFPHFSPKMVSRFLFFSISNKK